MLSAPSATPAEKSISATIRIDQEIQCLLYAVFFYLLFETILNIVTMFYPIGLSLIYHVFFTYSQGDLKGCTLLNW